MNRSQTNIDNPTNYQTQREDYKSKRVCFFIAQVNLVIFLKSKVHNQVIIQDAQF
jgi:hypothetical protein